MQRFLLKLNLLFLLAFAGTVFNCNKTIAATQENELPREALKILDTLPNNKLSLDVVIQQALLASDHFKEIKANFIKLPSSVLMAKSPLDVQTYIQGIRSLNKNETASPFSPTNTSVTQYTLGASTYFSTGTALSAEITHGYNLIGFATTNDLDYFETSGTLSLTQNLWKDSFGYSTRLGVTAGTLQQKAAEFQLDNSIEDWMDSIIKVFYQSKLAQDQTRAARANVKRKQRLYKITTLKNKRGTAEKPDLIQVKSALTHSEIDATNTKQSLIEVWRYLVTSLKFPESWLDINPMLIPLELDSPTNKALNYCGDASNLRPTPKDTALTQMLKNQLATAELKLKQAQNIAKPETQLILSLNSNGMDSSRGETWGETFGLDHPNWSVGLKFSVPLFNYESEANIRNALSAHEQIQAKYSKEKSDLKVDWLNSCNNLFNKKRNTQKLKTSYLEQLERNSLEEKRFQLGRIPVLSVIQAGDDATQTEVALRKSEIELKLAAWKILKLSNLYKNYLTELKTKKLIQIKE